MLSLSWILIKILGKQSKSFPLKSNYRPFFGNQIYWVRVLWEKALAHILSQWDRRGGPRFLCLSKVMKMRKWFIIDFLTFGRNDWEILLVQYIHKNFDFRLMWTKICLLLKYFFYVPAMWAIDKNNLVIVLQKPILITIISYLTLKLIH